MVEVIPINNQQRYRRHGRPVARDKAGNTICKVDEVLRKASVLAEWKFHTFVQGSARNQTNIEATSDVDVVVCAHIPTTYNDWLEFRQAVFGVFNGKSPLGKPERAHKTIKLSARAPLLAVDLVVCCEGEQPGQRTPRAGDGELPVETPIFFWSLAAEEPILMESYPQLHAAEVERIDKETGGLYRGEIRLIKRLCSSLKAPMPSYLLECVIGNAPAGCYSGKLFRTHPKIVDWLGEMSGGLACLSTLGGRKTIKASASSTDLLNLEDFIKHLVKHPDPDQPEQWYRNRYRDDE
ncbi:hypothetical protein [Alloactinosynnema sp. L-07]|uniref:hypothetical protein n=1 Tax=Alloactinosynnema sp. L-07 TaxID=1653480 RepID=UPI00065F0B52|nr:hypothetical protein [Alloactinosynnema sp. L-07]CRK55931.1 hypothetical protein [Alloactinosynnema sp. L-07]